MSTQTRKSTCGGKAFFSFGMILDHGEAAPAPRNGFTKKCFLLELHGNCATWDSEVVPGDLKMQ